MADNTAKARKMLEEAEKKSKGGGGFLGKLFGGGGSSDMPDFYVKSEEKEEMAVASDTEDESFGFRPLSDDSFASDDGGSAFIPSTSSYVCSAPRCLEEFGEAADLEQHLENRHDFRCQQCGRRFYEAGNLFKMDKAWKEAGDAFLKAAEWYAGQSDAKHDAASQYAEAANCYRKVNPAVAVDCLLKTSEIYTDMGRFTMAAKNHVTIAELYESDCPDKEQCIAHYQKAADYYKGEESKSSAMKCLIKVAEYAAELEQYRKAISVFEEIAFFEADHSTLKYAAKNHFFQALLCHLCIDRLDTQQALKRYEDAAPSFADSRECKLIKDILLCLEEQNVDAFTDAVTNFNKVSRLENWHTSLLVKVKRAIAAEDEEDLK